MQKKGKVKNPSPFRLLQTAIRFANLTWFSPRLFSLAPYQEPVLHPSSVQPLSDNPLAAPLVLVALLELAEVEAELVPPFYRSPQTLE